MCTDSEISALLSSVGSVVVLVGLQADEPTTKAIKSKSLNFIILELIENICISIIYGITAKTMFFKFSTFVPPILALCAGNSQFVSK
jgi:hypothetical protein